MKKQKVIALLTDFGLDDPYVAAIKGVILSITPDVHIVDISHSVEPQNIDKAAYLLWCSFKYFPRDTIFVCVVDPGVGTSRKILCVQTNGYKFIAPDNGILKFILGAVKRVKIVSVINTKYFLPAISTTFQGRDIFAPIAAHLANGLNIQNLGPKTTPLFHAEKFIEISAKSKNTNRGRIIHIDRFGNIVTNLLCITECSGMMQLIIGKKVIKEFSKTYADAKSTKPFMIIGSSSLLEISVKNGNAAKILYPKINDPVLLLCK